MDAVIGILSVIGFIASLILIVVFAIKKKKVYPPLISLVCCFAVFLVCVALPDSPSTPQTPTERSENEPTEEDKAAELLAKANVFFEKGNYTDGISTCESLQESYPDTAVAAGVPQFLTEKFSQFQNFSVNELLNAYANNIVNADKNITGNPVVVSGVVYKIGKLNGGLTLSILLDSNRPSCAVQLNFPTSQEDSIAKLISGDSISATGKCSGLSDNNKNVIISDCYIID